MANIYKFDSGVLGGTFDNFHSGHKFFIDSAFGNTKFLTIGITTDDFIKDKKLSGNIQSLKARKENVENFLREKEYLSRSKIIPISDIYGVTLTEKDIDVIFVTQDTLDNAKYINNKRKELGFHPLEIVIVELKKGNDEKVISSTRIRTGEIDEIGESFLRLFEKNEKLTLPNEYRDDFKKPIGEIISDSKILKNVLKDSFTIAVGDIVTSTLISIGHIPNLSIFDLKTRRENIEDKNILDKLPKPTLILNNEPGTIENSTAISIHTLILKSLDTKKPYSIKINGEEDLLTIPAILLAPLNSFVLYGLRDTGAVVVKVNLAKKKDLLNKYFSKLIIY